MDEKEHVIRIRGKDFPITGVNSEVDHVGRYLQGLLLALYAFEDPRVDEILKKFEFGFTWPDGKKVTRLFEKDA